MDLYGLDQSMEHSANVYTDLNDVTINLGDHNFSPDPLSNIDPAFLVPGQSGDNASHSPSAESSSSGIVKRKPIPRKGHTKSRRGCFNCKKRKIKCQETKPRCENCQKSELTCEYPIPITVIARANPTMQPQATPLVFSMKDMQYFQYFLVRGYPHLPLGADSVWTESIPLLAYEYDFLIHAVLALGASRLSMRASNPKEYKSPALTHRIEAVKLLNQALSTPAKTRDEADARFATLMCLTFQSTTMAEGMTDFLTMLRGCVLSGASVPEDSCFWSFMQRKHLETMDQRFNETQLEALDRDPLDAAMASLLSLKTFCKPGVQQQYIALLVNLIAAAYISPRDAYTQLTELYNIVGFVSHEEFRVISDKSDPVSQILLAHFLAIHKITKPLTDVENDGRTPNVEAVFNMFSSWVCFIHAGLEPQWRYLNEWPLSFITRNPSWDAFEAESNPEEHPVPRLLIG